MVCVQEEIKFVAKSCSEDFCEAIFQPSKSDIYLFILLFIYSFLLKKKL